MSAGGSGRSGDLVADDAGPDHGTWAVPWCFISSLRGAVSIVPAGSSSSALFRQLGFAIALSRICRTLSQKAPPNYWNFMWLWLPSFASLYSSSSVDWCLVFYIRYCVMQSLRAFRRAESRRSCMVRWKRRRQQQQQQPVSYTHLTLPTKRIV